MFAFIAFFSVLIFERGTGQRVALLLLLEHYILEKSMFLVPQVPTKYRHDPSKNFGIHLVPQVSKPDKLGPKPDFEHVDRV